MKQGNPQELDAARHALLDSFDAVWMAESKLTPRGRRALRCARIMGHADFHVHSPNTLIGRGWRCTAPDVLPCPSVATLIDFNNDIASALRVRNIA